MVRKLGIAAGGALLWGLLVPMLQQQKPEWFSSPRALWITIIAVLLCFVPLAIQVVRFVYGLLRPLVGQHHALLSFAMIIIVAFVAVLLIGGGYYLFRSGQHRIADSAVVLIGPEGAHTLTWVPELSISPEIHPAGKTGYPDLTLRNLIQAPVTPISTEWLISDAPIDTIVASNEHFKKYQPSLKNGMFSITNAKGGGVEMPVGDRDEINIPYLEREPLPVSFPATIWNSFALRLIAKEQRPSNFGSDGFIKTSGPIISVTIRYRRGEKDYIRYFKIKSAITVVSDTSGIGGGIGSVPRQFWSPDNFRALIRFSVIAQ